MVGSLVLAYGSPVNQDVEAPEKESNFFFDYKFIRWGSEGQTVTGDLKVEAVYKSSLTGAGSTIVFGLCILIFGAIVVAASKKKIR